MGSRFGRPLERRFFVLFFLGPPLARAMVGFTEVAPLLVAWLAPLLVLATLLSTTCAMAPKRAKKDDGGDAGKPKRQRVSAKRGEGLDKADADKMRNWLKNHAQQKDENGAATAQALAAQAAQAMWNEMKAPGDRKRFLQTFQNDAEKSLQWVATFHESCTNSEVHEKSAVKGYVNVSQALAFKNLRLENFSGVKEAMDFVQDWWEENSEEYKTKEAFPVKEDPKKRDLWKQWYLVHKNLDEDKLITKDQRSFLGRSDLKNLKAIETATRAMAELPSSSPQGPASSSEGAGQVKVENPHWQEIQTKAEKIESRPRQPSPADPSQRGSLSQASPPHPLPEGGTADRVPKEKIRKGKIKQTKNTQQVKQSNRKMRTPARTGKHLERFRQ